jgi:GT2 family glycosyltransferase
MNNGHAAAVNTGLAMVRPRRAALVIDPGVRLDRGSVAALWDALRPFDTGICVPRLRDTHGRLRHSLRHEPTVLRVLGDAVFGGDRPRWLDSCGEVVTDDRLYTAPQVAAGATGAVMLISSECLNAVGPWDESSFRFSEETDFILRARDHGFLLRYVPHAGAVQLDVDQDLPAPLWALSQPDKVRLQLHRSGRAAAHTMRWALVLNAAFRARHSPAHRQALRALLSANPVLGFPPAAEL